MRWFILIPTAVILGVLCSVAGLVMIWIGATGVRDRCLCGYDLRGLPRKALRCPECGRRGGPFITVKRPRLLSWGLALFLIPPVVAAAGYVLMLLWIVASGYAQ